MNPPFVHPETHRLNPQPMAKLIHKSPDQSDRSALMVGTSARNASTAIGDLSPEARAAGSEHHPLAGRREPRAADTSRAPGRPGGRDGAVTNIVFYEASWGETHGSLTDYHCWSRTVSLLIGCGGPRLGPSGGSTVPGSPPRDGSVRASPSLRGEFF